MTSCFKALTWGLITGFKSPFPWFYTAFFIPMILHRAIRDQQKCRGRYGAAWEEYERQVPYLFIPVSTRDCPFFLCNEDASTDGWMSFSMCIRF